MASYFSGWQVSMRLNSRLISMNQTRTMAMQTKNRTSTMADGSGEGVLLSPRYIPTDKIAEIANI